MSSPGISFPTIPSNIRVPGVYFDFAATGQPSAGNQNSLLIGNTVTAQPALPVYVANIAQGVALFGAGSILARMVEAYLTADPNATLYALPVADAEGGTAASGSFAFTGTATAAGSLSLYVGEQLVSVAVTVGMTAAQLATAVVAAINAWTSANGVALPVTAAIDETHNYQADLTANNKGTPGNSITLGLNYYGAQQNQSTPAGITVAIVAMSGGETDPTTSGFAAALGSTNYDFIAMPWSTTQALNDFQTLLESRWAYSNMAYGGAFTAKMDADATGATNIAFGLDRNDQHMVCISYEPSPSTPWAVAAAAMGAFAQSSRADAARPTQTLPIPGILAPPETGQYSFPTQNTLLNSGMALMQYNSDGTCAIRRMVTTYQKNGAGAPDVTYKDAETLYALMYGVRYTVSYIKDVAPRAKFAANGTALGPGQSFTNGLADQPIITPNGIGSLALAAYTDLVNAGQMQDVQFFKQNMLSQANATDPTRDDLLLPFTMMSGLRIVAALVQPSLSASS